MVNTATKGNQAATVAQIFDDIGGTLDDIDDVVAVAGSAKYKAAETMAKIAGGATSSSKTNAAFNALETAVQSGSDDAINAAVNKVNTKVFGAASASTTVAVASAFVAAADDGVFS